MPEVITINADKLLANWKTTANGILSAAIAVIVALAALPPHLRWYVYVLSGLRVLVALKQKDAGKEVVQVPGQAATQVVDSHETPDVPGAQVK